MGRLQCHSHGMQQEDGNVKEHEDMVHGDWCMVTGSTVRVNHGSFNHVKEHARWCMG